MIKQLKTRKEGFIQGHDKQFIENYAIEQFKELLNREKINVFQKHFDYGPEFMYLYGNSMMRAYVINKMFGIAAEPELKMIDKGIVFQAVGLFDRYYEMSGTTGMD